MKSDKSHSQGHHLSADSGPGTKLQADASAPSARNSVGDGRFRLAFERAPLGMAIIDLDYKPQRVNQALCQALGYSEAELLSRSFISITHPDDIGKDKALAAELLAGEIPSYRIEKRFITKDGSLAWLDITVVLIRGENNEALYGLAMGDNITGRKRAQEALRTSEERYRSFVVNSSEGIWRFEVEQPIDTTLPVDEQIALFYKHAYLAECNDAMARMYGHARADDIVGSRFGEFALASNPTNISALRKFISQGYRLHEVETTDLNADGSEKHFSNSVIGIVINGQLLRIWGALRDETLRKQAEDELKRSHAQLRSLARRLQSVREHERTHIAREMHDVLGQSLTSLKLDLSWLRKTLPLNVGEEFLSSGLRERTDRMAAQLDDTITAVQTLSTELRPGILDKFGLMAAVEWQCQEFELRTGIKCIYKVPEKKLPLNNERSTTLFRILQEALVNVARHSRASIVNVELRPGKWDLTLIVSDNGRGITSAEILDPASLGLLGMRERAGMLGGQFTIEPRTGKGTTATAQIPLSDPAGSEPTETGNDQSTNSLRPPGSAPRD